MLWYACLEEEDQYSWRRLRRALVNHYSSITIAAPAPVQHTAPRPALEPTPALAPPARPPSASSDHSSRSKKENTFGSTNWRASARTFFKRQKRASSPPRDDGPKQESSPAVTPSVTSTTSVTPAPAQPPDPAPSTHVRQGRIMVIDSYDGRPLGFISRNPRGVLKPSKNDSLIVEVPEMQSREPFQLKMLNGDSTDSEYQYLGIHHEVNVTSKTTEAWTLRACSESMPEVLHMRRSSVLGIPGALGSSAVWMLHKREQVEELQIRWIESTGSHCLLLGCFCMHSTGEVVPSVRRPTELPKLPNHRRARFVFRPLGPNEDITAPRSPPPETGSKPKDQYLLSPMLLSEVPVEVLLDHILPALPLSALLALTCTSKFFALVCSDDTFWKLKLHRDYNFTPNADTARETGWKLIYRGIRKPSVYTWGAAGQGRLGLRSLPRGHNFGVPYPVKVDINARIVSLVAGGWCFYALDDQGHLRVWGQMDGDAFALQSDGFSEASKKAKTPHRLQISYPNSGSGAVKFSAVSCARSISAALDSQSNVWIFTNWGRPVLLTSPLVSSGLTESGPRDPENAITQVECGWDFVSMLTRGGSAYVIWPTGQQSQFASLLNSQNTQLNNEGDATKGHPQEVDGEDVIPCTTIAIQADPLRLPALPRDLPDLSRQFSVAESGVSGAEPTGYGREVDPRNEETRLVRIAAGDCFIIGLTNKGHVLSLDVTGGASNGPEWLRINWMRQGWVYLPEYCELEK
ncbi:hypothetical protein FRB99_008927, partial [Tulasnella sp. 403]